MKKAQLILLLFAWFFQAAAQDKTVAELKKDLGEHSRWDSSRVNRLLDLSVGIFVSFDERKKFSAEALAISRAINYPKGEAFALSISGVQEILQGNVKAGDSLLIRADSLAAKSTDPEFIGYILYRKGNRMNITGDKAGLGYLLKAEKIFEQSKLYKRLALCQESIAGIYQSILSNYPAAMKYLLKSSRNAEKSNSTDVLFLVWNDIATVYLLIGDYDNALVYCKKAYEYNKREGVGAQNSSISNTMGEIYRLTGKYPEAITAYTEALKFNSSLYITEVNESNLADVYTRMNNLPLAFQYGFSSLAKANQLGDSTIMAWIYGILSRAYLKKGMPDSAIYYARPGLDMSTSSGSIENMRDNAAALANAYAYKKDFANAYRYNRQFVTYKDSIVNSEIRNRTAVLQYNNDLDKKEAQIVQLNQQKKAQQNFLISALIVIVLVLLTAVILLRNNRQKQKANKLLQKQKQEIDDKAAQLSVQKDNLQQSYNNVELLGEIGHQVSSSLSVEKIIGTVYNNVNALMDANVFGIGIYNEALSRIEFPATYENGVALPFYFNHIDESNRFAVLCFKDEKEIIMGNLATEYKMYTQQVLRPTEGKQSVSLLYLPLVVKGKKLGVITVQSFEENAYTDYHLFMLRNIAIYTAIALENAESYEELNHTVDRLQSTQTQLIQSEKMASLGELTAGIAHEIQNPLNFVNNFSEVNIELIEELKTERTKPIAERNDATEDEILKDIKQNLEKINMHGKRADSIVKGMLQHSQSSTGAKEPTDINALTDEYLRLAYHGLRAKDKSFNATIKTEFDQSIHKVPVVPQDMGRVLLNLVNNAYYTVNEKSKSSLPVTALANEVRYEPTVTVSTMRNNGHIEIKIKDNGNGIPQKILDKIFQPFFTTKPTGQGTGLGLSLSYDIVKAHGGKLKVETHEGEGTTFTVQLQAV